VSGEERYRQTCELLASLSERDFAVIRIVWLENRSLNEAAAELRCSAEAAGKRLSRAMFRLSSRLTSGIRDHVR
jgi:DNA-directed RNA polymerase specialized sigma24 family protein